MKLQINIDGDIEELMKDEAHRMGVASTAAMRFAGETLKGIWRRQIVGAGLGNRLANTIRHDPYPKTGFSYTPAGLVYSKAPKIIDAFEHGTVIKAGTGSWLAIPLPVVGKTSSGRRFSPGEWQFRTGRKLRFVHNRSSRTAFLVADDARISDKTGLAKVNRKKRRRDGILTGSQTIPVYVLVPRTSIAKKLDLMAAAEQLGATLPWAIVQRWTGSRNR